MPYTIIVDTLYMRKQDNVLCWCVTSLKIPLIFIACHDNMVGSHFGGDVMLERYYTVAIGGLAYLYDCTTYIKQCDACQRIRKPFDYSVVPFKPILALEHLRMYFILLD